MSCQKRRYSDQYYCSLCGTQWDVNDPEPPRCEVEYAKSRAEAIGRKALDEIKHSLEEDTHVSGSKQENT